MKVLTLTRDTETTFQGGDVFASEAAAEAYQNYRTALKSQMPAERLAAVNGLVECGSSAVFPLLRTIEDDEDLEVTTGALWSLLRLTDDMLGGRHDERDSPGAIIDRGRLTEPYLRLGLEAVAARAVGGSPADTAYAWVHRLGRRSHEAGIRFLSDLVRLAPDLDPQLPDVLRRMARRHPLPWIRPNGVRLLREYEAWKATGETPRSAVLAKSLAERRLAVESEHMSEATSRRLLAAATVDPDRTVRHLAGARLYHLIRKGLVGTTPRGVNFKDTELQALFLEGCEGLEAHPKPAESLRRVADRSARTRRCVLRLVTHLRPVVTAVECAELDEFVRRSMRDEDREVRREATSVATSTSSESIYDELAGRLRERLRLHPPFVFFVLLGAALLSFPISFVFRDVWWVRSMPPFLMGGFNLYIALRDRSGKHKITSDECYETLVALERVAESSPEKLTASVPELRKLAGLGLTPGAVRLKARELLAKVHEATLHELPIAAEPPQGDPAALPLPSSGPQRG